MKHSNSVVLLSYMQQAETLGRNVYLRLLRLFKFVLQESEGQPKAKHPHKPFKQAHCLGCSLEPTHFPCIIPCVEERSPSCHYERLPRISTQKDDSLDNATWTTATVNRMLFLQWRISIQTFISWVPHIPYMSRYAKYARNDLQNRTEEHFCIKMVHWAWIQSQLLIGPPMWPQSRR